MAPRFRPVFNQQITPERYEWYQNELSRRLNCRFEFRLAETPVFLPDDLRQQLADRATANVKQLSDPARLNGMKAAIPQRWNTPGMDALPSFAQVDFAIVNENGRFVPKLIE